jgi:hypothetical protein
MYGTFKKYLKKTYFLLASILSATDKKKQDPDPYQNVTDPQHWFVQM